MTRLCAAERRLWPLIGVDPFSGMERLCISVITGSDIIGVFKSITHARLYCLSHVDMESAQ